MAAGKSADLLVLEVNPLADVSATRDAEAVVLRGRLIDAGELERMRAEIRARVTARNARFTPSPAS